MQQQLAEEGEGASQPPPCGRGGAEGAADEQRHVPLRVHTQEDGDARVQGRDDDLVLVEVGVGVCDGGVVWRGRF